MRYRASKTGMQSLSDTSPPCEFSASSPRISCNSWSSSSTAIVPDWDMDHHVQNPASLPHRIRRKLPKLLAYNKVGAISSSSLSSACSTLSSATAAELPGSSPSALLKASIKAVALEETNYTPVDDMTPHISYTDAPATRNSDTTLSLASSEVATVSTSTPDNALKLERITSSGTTSTSISTTDTDASHATEDTTLLSPPSSSSSLVPSCSSSSAFSEHSSYSATHKIDHNINTTTDTSRRGSTRKLTSASTQIETRANSASLRPLGPAHLEYDYTIARKALSTAVAIAAYELFGFSVPIRNDEFEAKRPGKESIPLLREHSLVRRAARAVDDADKALEAALARGETFENVPIPDEWRWGSEFLRPYEWAYLEPEPNKEKKIRRPRKFYDAAEIGEPRTRAQKRRSHEPSEDDTSVKNEDEETTLASTHSSSIATPIKAMSEHTHASSEVSTSQSSSSLTAEPSFRSSPESRKRGRPRKNASDSSSSTSPQIQVAAVTVPGPFPVPTLPITCVTNSAAESKSLAADAPPMKRKRGRPRKHPLPSSSGVNAVTVATKDASTLGLRQLKKRKLSTSSRASS